MEREAKLLVPPDYALPELDDLVDLVPGGTVRVFPDQRLEATYYDTDDHRLAGWGTTLRWRLEDSDGRWTLKLPAAGSGAGQLVRSEVEVPGEPGAVPEPMQDLVRAYTRSSALRPVAHIVTVRRRQHLLSGAGELLIEIDDDRVSVMRGERVDLRFHEVEVEQRGEAPPKLLRAVVERIGGDGAIDDRGVPKVVRALGLETLTAEVTVPVVDGGAAVGAAVQQAIAAGVDRLLRHDPGVRLGDDAEEVHQARVATRRLRSDLRTFRDALDPEWTARVRAGLKWIADALGAVRDADVLAARLVRQIERLDEADQGPGAALLGQLARERDEARQALVEIMGEPRYLTLVEDLVRAAGAPPLASGKLPGEWAAAVLPGLVAARWRQLAKAVRGLGPAPDDAALHQVRIRAKRARYAAEAVAPVAGARARKLAARLADLQTMLGELNDAAVAQRWLRAHTGRAAQALVAGQLIQVQRDEAARWRAAWPKAWSRASKRRLRTWL